MKSISDDQIRERAYLLAESHGFPHGMEFEFWLEAEKELMEEALAGDKTVRPPPVKKTVKKKAAVKKTAVKKAPAKAPAQKAVAKKKVAKKSAPKQKMPKQAS